MNRLRLEHTARKVLPYVEPQNLQMGSWVCGTAACAFGHECLSEFGKRNGLAIRRTPRGGICFPVLAGNGDCFDAVTKYYGIDYHAAEWIFDPSYYTKPPTPAEVAERIEALLVCESCP